MFQGTVTKWPVQKQTHRTTQNHTEHQDATYIQNRLCLCVCFGFFYLIGFIYDLKYFKFLILCQ